MWVARQQLSTKTEGLWRGVLRLVHCCISTIRKSPAHSVCSTNIIPFSSREKAVICLFKYIKTDYRFTNPGDMNYSVPLLFIIDVFYSAPRSVGLVGNFDSIIALLSPRYSQRCWKFSWASCRDKGFGEGLLLISPSHCVCPHGPFICGGHLLPCTRLKTSVPRP